MKFGFIINLGGGQDILDSKEQTWRFEDDGIAVVNVVSIVSVTYVISSDAAMNG